MKSAKNRLLLHQVDAKLEDFKEVDAVAVPNGGWIKSIRSVLGMSLRQLANKLHITPQSISDMERREVSGAITLRTMEEIGSAMGLRFVYGFVPKHGSLEAMIEKRALELAQEIVQRANVTMALEDQQNSSARIQAAIREKAKQIKYEMPRYLWD